MVYFLERMGQLTLAAGGKADYRFRSEHSAEEQAVVNEHIVTHERNSHHVATNTCLLVNTTRIVVTC